MEKEPITGNPGQVLTELAKWISAIINDNSVKEFYIGRTVDLNKRQSDHGCDKIKPIYKTDSTNNAIIVENNLIKKFYVNSKCSNESEHGGGGISEEYVSYVYVAIWYGSVK